MKSEERKKAVLAMEFLARSINDEEVLEGWLMGGVADGDIPAGSWDTEDVDLIYIEDSTFRDLMRCFMRRMTAAYKSGGLWIDDVLSGDKDDED